MMASNKKWLIVAVFGLFFSSLNAIAKPGDLVKTHKFHNGGTLRASIRSPRYEGYPSATEVELKRGLLTLQIGIPSSKTPDSFVILPMNETYNADLGFSGANALADTMAMVRMDSQSWVVTEDRKVFKVPYDVHDLRSWSGVVKKINKETYLILTTVHESSGKAATSVVRMSDSKIKVLSRVAYDYSNPDVIEVKNGEFILKGSDAASTLKFDFLKFEDTTPVSKSQQFYLEQAREVEIAGRFKDKVYGQDYAIDRTSYRLVHTPPTQGKPLVMVWVGPSGVGKTELGHALAGEAFDEPVEEGVNFVEINGADYQSFDGVASMHTLTGSEEAYKGNQEGVLIQAAKKGKGDLVVLWNEADKTDTGFFKALMEFWDRGVITDKKTGKNYVFKRLIFVMTSNRSSERLFPTSISSWSEAEIKQRALKMTSEFLKSELARPTDAKDTKAFPDYLQGRIAEYIGFSPLSVEADLKIAKMVEKSFVKAIFEKYAVHLEFESRLLEQIILANPEVAKNGRVFSRTVFDTLKKIQLEAFKHFGPEDNQKITFEVKERPGSQKLALIEQTGGKEFESALLPVPKSFNPLADPVEREIINNVKKVLLSRVIGQDEAMDNFAEAIVSHRNDPFRKRPLVLMAVSGSGVGKTETGKAIAEAVHGSPERMEIIDLGAVKDEAGLNRIFGADPGYAGYDKEQAFEKALKRNPDGGVITLDEASNMGGADKGKKNSLFKSLYTILEEGVWTSPATGITYDLSKYTFLLTGNDGEGLFQGISDDAIKLQIWAQNKSREKVAQLLIEAGVPDALLNRTILVMMKPLIRSEMSGIVKKFLDAKFIHFEKQYPGLKVSYDPHFIEQVANSFFEGSRGARGIRSIVDDRMPALLTTALVNSQLSVSNLEGFTLKVGLLDNVGSKGYRDPSDPERRVLMKMGIYKPENPHQAFFEQHLDLTNFAAARYAWLPEVAIPVAAHEAGHGVLGRETLFITILGGKVKDLEYFGVAVPKEAPAGMFTRASIIQEIATLYAGAVAQQLIGYERDSGWGNDLEKMRLIAKRAILDLGFDDQFIGVILDKDKIPVLTESQKRLLTFKIDQMLKEGRVLAEAVLKERWELVLSISNELLEHGRINDVQMAEMKKEFEARKAKGLVKSFDEMTVLERIPKIDYCRRKAAGE